MSLPSRLACIVLLSCACAAPRPAVEAEKEIADSLELPGAVVFHRHGLPIDTPHAATDALTLSDAVRRAVEGSPELQQALARVRIAEADCDLARLLPNPVLTFTERFPEGGGKPDLEASLGIDLLSILQRPRRSSAAGRRLEAEAASALSTAIDLVAETQELYADAQALEELVPLLEARVSVLDRLREVLQARLDLGEGTRHEVTTLDAERMDLAVEASQRRRELRLARLALARRIGEPSGAAAWKLDAWQGPAAVPTVEIDWIEAALAARPEILAIQWEILARGDDRAIAASDSWDGLSASVVGERDDGEESLGAGVAVPLRLFDRGGARKRRATAVELESWHRLTEAQRGVVEEVRAALEALTGSQENLGRVARELIPLQERRRDEIDEAFRSGFVDITSLLLAEQALQQSQTRRVGLEREVSAAHVRLERAVGGPAAFRVAIATNEEDPRP